MQVVRRLQKPGAIWEATERISVPPGLTGSVSGVKDVYLVDFPLPADRAALELSKKIVMATAEFVAPLL
jgi:hypothetical protein